MRVCNHCARLTASMCPTFSAAHRRLPRLGRGASILDERRVFQPPSTFFTRFARRLYRRAVDVAERRGRECHFARKRLALGEGDEAVGRKDGGFLLRRRGLNQSRPVRRIALAVTGAGSARRHAGAARCAGIGFPLGRRDRDPRRREEENKDDKPAISARAHHPGRDGECICPGHRRIAQSRLKLVIFQLVGFHSSSAKLARSLRRSAQGKDLLNFAPTDLSKD
jgi:hypothetical protein